MVMRVTHCLILLFCFFSLVSPTLAQEEALLDPPQVTLAGMHGDESQSRRVFLRAPRPLEADQLRILTQELTRADNLAVLPAAAIQVAVKPLSDNEFQLDLRFDLQQIPGSGEYQGKIRIHHGQGEIFLPVSLRLKHDWRWPVAFLLAGTFLGVGVSLYRGQGRPRDRILLQVAQLRAQIDGDPQARLAEPFVTRVEAILVDVEAALRNESWEEGRKAVRQAQAVWNTWRKGRLDWSSQLEYHRELQHRLEVFPSELYFIRELDRELDSLYRGMPDYREPRALHDALNDLGRQLNRYLDLYQKLVSVNELCQKLPQDANSSAFWDQAEALEKRFEQLHPQPPGSEKLPENLETLEQLQGELQKLCDELKRFTPGGREVRPDTPESARTEIAPLESAPAVQFQQDWEGAAQAAHWRLRLFAWFGYATTVIFLAGAGFSELYLDQPTFGLNPVKDYLGLLAWGFGAEASREALTRVVREWGQSSAGSG